MKTQREFNLEYWGRVHDMCTTYNKEHQGNVNPWECVKLTDPSDLRDEVFIKDHPNFKEIMDYTYCVEFAVAILEGKPVFVGDTLYTKGKGLPRKVTGVSQWHESVFTEQGGRMLDSLTWTPPASKRTFMLNGVEFPCPVENRDKQYTDRHFASLQFEFATADEGEEFMTKLRDILDKAMGS